MSIDLNALNTATTTAAGIGAILASAKNTVGITPMNADPQVSALSLAQSTTSIFNPQSFLFHYNGEESVVLESDITDHYVESNKAIQDHIAKKPITYSVTGYIGELNDVLPSVLAPLKLAAETLILLAPYTPELTITAIEAYNTAFQAYQIARNAINVGIAAYGLISGRGTQNKQQSAFTQLEAYYNNNTLFKVQTPWRIYQNMAIKSMKAVQSAETNTISDFEITFKQMQFAATYQQAAALLASGRAGEASASVTDLGVNTLNPGPDFGVPLFQ